MSVAASCINFLVLFLNMELRFFIAWQRLAFEFEAEHLDM